MTPVAFILGAGRHVGLAVAIKLKQEGYKVAIGSRNPIEKEGFVPITVDVTDTDSISRAFVEVREKLGSAPNAVIFNAYSFAPPDVPGDPLSISLSGIKEAAAVSVGLYAAAQQAVAGFRTLPIDSPLSKTFIFTGNRLPWLPRDSQWADFLTVGIQKVDGAYMMETFHTMYEKEGFRFYFGDENKSDGSPVGLDWNDAAHATAYWDVISNGERKDWYLRFNGGGKPLPPRCRASE